MSRATSFRPMQGSSPSNQLASSTSVHLIPNLSELESNESAAGVIKVPPQQLACLLMEYQWRQQTEFPIVRIISHSVLSSTLENVQLSIVTEEITTILSELGELPLFKAIYLIKESLVGFERLFSKYGSFLPTPAMIGINKDHKCKVWINQDFTKNEVMNLPLSENCFLKSVCKMFQERTLKLKSSQLFYQGIQKETCFHSAMNYLESYVKQNKVMVPSSFRHIQKEVGKGGSTRLQQYGTLKRESARNAPVRGTFSYAADPNKMLPVGATKKQLCPVQVEPKINSQQFPVKIQTTVTKKVSQVPLKESAETRADLIKSGQKELSPKPRERFMESLRAPYPKLKRITSSLRQNTSLFPGSMPALPRERKPTYCGTSHYNNQDPQSPIAGLKSEVLPASVKIVYNSETKEVVQDFGALFQQNNWEPKVGGLFTGMAELKKSIQTGKEIGWSEAVKNDRQLNLLDQFGGDLQTSQLRQTEAGHNFT